MRGWRLELAALVLPVACAGCGRPRAPSGVCEECAGELYGAGPARVRPVPEPPGLPVVHAAARYEDVARAVLLAHKERGALGLAEPLGAALARAVAGALPATEAQVGAATPGTPGAYTPGRWVDGPAVEETREAVLVPVPSVRRSVGARGHDPVRRIAYAAAAELRRSGVRARVAPVLRHRRAVGDQVGLGARERSANLAGALEVVPGGHRLLASGEVVLVDDLMTTGASLAEAARAIAPGAGPGAGTGNTAMRESTAAVVAAPPLSFEINWN
ncbi:ComF family protein [Streptomyces candidus]|uniref:ComF family protein n=1 Tax=Streptomyces candidus TaxID=67283 RepID=UPI00161F5B4B|nr:ComF family protein [Streptomyces candidus]